MLCYLVVALTSGWQRDVVGHGWDVERRHYGVRGRVDRRLGREGSRAGRGLMEALDSVPAHYRATFVPPGKGMNVLFS